MTVQGKVTANHSQFWRHAIIMIINDTRGCDRDFETCQNVKILPYLIYLKGGGRYCYRREHIILRESIFNKYMNPLITAQRKVVDISQELIQFIY